MFSFLYITNIKILIRSKETFITTLIIPLLIATLFYTSLGRIGEADNFSSISIGVVANEENVQYQYFMSAINSAKTDSGKSLFKVEMIEEKDIEEKLQKKEIKAVLKAGEQIEFIVNESGVEQTVVQLFIEEFAAKNNAVMNLIALTNDYSIVENITVEDYIVRNEGEASTDYSNYYFYTALAMTCLFGSLFGCESATNIQANMSASAIRVNVSPVKKLRIFLVSMLSSATILFFEVGIVLAYMIGILRVDFGNRVPLVCLTCLMGIFVSLALGAMIGVLVKKDENYKGNVLAGITMIQSFLAGMMILDMKLLVQDKAPFLGYINIANLLSDSFYSLCIFSSLDRYILNMAIMGVLTIIFSAISVIAIRSEKYASI